MSFLLGNDEVLSDSEYESAASRSDPSKLKIGAWKSDYETQRSHPPTPLEIPPFDVEEKPVVPTGKEKAKKRPRRGTGVPASFLRFPRGRVDEDVDKIGETIKNEVVVSAHTLISTAKTRRDLLLQELKRNTHLEQESSLPKPSASADRSRSPYQQRSPATDCIHNPSPSITLAFRPKQESNKLNRENELQSLQQSLTQIRAHLAALESAIAANITSQLLCLTGSSDPPVADSFSLPSFQVEKKQNETVGAILGTVKVVCAVGLWHLDPSKSPTS